MWSYLLKIKNINHLFLSFSEGKLQRSKSAGRIGSRLISLLLLGLLCTCGPAPKNDFSPTIAVGSVRYQEDIQRLDADLSIDPVGSYVPSLYGSAMPPFDRAGPGHFRTRRTLPFPGKLSFSIPCSAAEGLCPKEIPFTPPFADSIPTVFSQSKTLSFLAGSTGLLKAENLIVFFEPDDRSAPTRITLQGPTQSGLVTVPKKALLDVAPGKYQVYMIKQQLHKDSTALVQTSFQTEYFTKSITVTVNK